MRGLLYLALAISMMIFFVSSFMVWVNYKAKKASLERQFERKEKDIETYVTNLERDLLRKESD